MIQTLERTVDPRQLTSIVDLPENIQGNMVTLVICYEVAAAQPKSYINQKIANKFLDPKRHDKFVSHLKQKETEGFQFAFDTQKIISDTMTDIDLEAFGKALKQGWSKAVSDMGSIRYTLLPVR
ncbi:MAG: hypothetical protein LBM77_02590 [Spirochaetaceae bacterium]|jgi:uncharacterized protein YejL (UPF0352 family)|nr:hypothetical protein [Spirochaetaceae bacterium]